MLAEQNVYAKKHITALFSDPPPPPTYRLVRPQRIHNLTYFIVKMYKKYILSNKCVRSLQFKCCL